MKRSVHVILFLLISLSQLFSVDLIERENSGGGYRFPYFDQFIIYREDFSFSLFQNVDEFINYFGEPDEIIKYDYYKGDKEIYNTERITYNEGISLLYRKNNHQVIEINISSDTFVLSLEKIMVGKDKIEDIFSSFGNSPKYSNSLTINGQKILKYIYMAKDFFLEEKESILPMSLYKYVSFVFSQETGELISISIYLDDMP